MVYGDPTKRGPLLNGDTSSTRGRGNAGEVINPRGDLRGIPFETPDEVFPAVAQFRRGHHDVMSFVITMLVGAMLPQRRHAGDDVFQQPLLQVFPWTYI